jgi:hypothetical protein
MSRATFLDRDGLISRKPPEGQYVTRWEDMQFLPGAAEGIALLNRAGFQVIVISNQRCGSKVGSSGSDGGSRQMLYVAEAADSDFWLRKMTPRFSLRCRSSIIRK